MPSRTAYALCPHAVFLPVRGQRYGEISRQVMEVLESFTPMVEPVSIDEAFLDIAGVLRRWPGGPVELGRALKQRVRDVTGGLTASVGVASNKFLAKLCSDLQKPDGLTVAPDTPAAILPDAAFPFYPPTSQTFSGTTDRIRPPRGLRDGSGNPVTQRTPGTKPGLLRPPHCRIFPSLASLKSLASLFLSLGLLIPRPRTRAAGSEEWDLWDL